LNSEHADKFLSEDKRQEIVDKTVMYLKIRVISILRDIKDISAEEANALKADPILFIQNRLQFGKDSKEHATLALNSEAINDAMKIYRKGHGAMKMVANNLIRDAKNLVRSSPVEEEKLEVLLANFKQVQVALMLNQGLCHWRCKEWEKMKQVNEEIVKLHDITNVKAYFRLATACKELEFYDQGLVSYLHVNIS